MCTASSLDHLPVECTVARRCMYASQPIASSGRVGTPGDSWRSEVTLKGHSAEGSYSAVSPLSSRAEWCWYSQCGTWVIVDLFLKRDASVSTLPDLSTHVNHGSGVVGR